MNTSSQPGSGPYQSSRWPHPPHIRFSEAEREAVSARLRDAHADGRLSQSEFLSRLDALYEARTYGDLDPVLAGLGQIGWSDPAATQQPATAPGRHPVSVGPARWKGWRVVFLVALVVWGIGAIAHGAVVAWPLWLVGFLVIAKVLRHGRQHSQPAAQPVSGHTPAGPPPADWPGRGRVT